MGQADAHPILGDAAAPEPAGPSAEPGIIQDATDAPSVIAWCAATKERLWSELEGLVCDLSSEAPRIELHSISAHGVPDADNKQGSGGSDPFVTFQLLDAPGPPLEVRTTVKQDTADPSWEGELLRLALPTDHPRPPRLRITVLDRTNMDDPIASLDVELFGGTGAFQRGKLMLRGQSKGGKDTYPDVELCFVWTLSEAEDVEAMAHFREIKDSLEYTLLTLGRQQGRQEIADALNKEGEPPE